ncbi:MAG TPA: hypothetical protein VHG51_09790, partial [Longimicrobiaceae bacterium]|nr:hypothetical protein [Longimicrobiaceae bacterium]
MQFMLLVYVDPELAAALPTGEADDMMRACLQHADELRRDGTLLDSQMLADAGAARAVRVRRERVTVLDGPYAEA